MLPGTQDNASLTVTVTVKLALLLPLLFLRMKVGFAECAEIFRLIIYLTSKAAKRASSETEFSEHP